MQSSNNSLIFLFVMVMTLARLSLAQNSPRDFVASQNLVRAKLGLNPFTWNATVAKYAQNYAYVRSKDCLMVHSQAPHYGENIAYGSGNFTGVDAVKLWVDEKPYYNYLANACQGEEQCLHYTQVVWRNTKQIGCARAQCTNNGYWFITCNYYPPGNYIGQRPY